MKYDSLIFAQYGNFRHIMPESIPWIPKTTESLRTPRVPSDKGIFTCLKGTQPKKGLWDLVQYSMPPFLARKFHIVNIDELRKDHKNGNIHIEAVTYNTATSFAMWNEALGTSLFNLINNKHVEFFNSESDYEDRDQEALRLLQWSEDVLDFVKYLQMTNVAPYIDRCKTASEFLLEPCIHIQLPWKPVLLHQWLTAAFAEVLRLEIISVEFRHWPLTEEMLPLAESLLSLILKLKENVLLGFVLLSEQVADGFDRKHPDMILDKVVLPSLPILRYLLSGKANQLIKLMKISAFSKGEKITNLESLKYTSPKTYCTNNYFTRFNEEFCYNSYIWCVSDFHNKKMMPSFHKYEEKCMEPNFYQIDEECEIRSLALLLATTKTSLSNLSLEEMISLTLKTIKEKVYGGIMPKLNLSDVENILRTNVPDTFTEHPSIKFKNTIFKICMRYHYAYRLLLDSEKENSALAQIIRLRLKFLEKHCLSELIAVLIKEFKISAIATKLENSNPIDIIEMMKELRKVHNEVEYSNRDLLWFQFHSEWRKSVNPGQKPPTISQMDTSLAFQNRIGRLVYNIAVHSFTVNARGGQPNPDWNLIQYVLPCIAAGYKDQCRTPGYHANLIKFIDGVIRFYERRYLVWIFESLDTPVITLTKYNLETNLKKEWAHMHHKLREQLYIVLGNKISNSEKFDDIIIPGIHHVYHYMNQWPVYVILLVSNEFPDLQSILNTWWEYVVKFTERLLFISLDVFDVPDPGSEITACPKLGHLYKTSSIISELEVVFDLSEKFVIKNETLRNLIDDSKTDMHQSRYEILRAVFDVPSSMTKKELEGFIAAKKSLEIKLYSKLKAYRLQHKTEFKTCLMQLLPLSRKYPDLAPAVTHYLNGDFAALEAMMPLFAPSNKGPGNSVVALAKGSQSGVNQVGGNQAGVNQSGVNQSGVNQVGGSQSGVNQVGGNQVGGNQSGVNQVGRSQSGVNQARGSQSRGTKSWGSQVGVIQAKRSRVEVNQAGGSHELPIEYGMQTGEQVAPLQLFLLILSLVQNLSRGQ